MRTSKSSSSSRTAQRLRAFVCASVLSWCAQSHPAFAAEEDPPELKNPMSAKLQIPVYQFKNDSVKQKGIVIAMHALLLSGMSYGKFARHLASNGYTVYAPDVRGFGKTRGGNNATDGVVRADFQAAREDLRRLVTHVRQDNPDTPIFILGESMGADFALWLLADATHANSIDGAIVSAPGFKFRLHPDAKTFFGVMGGVVQSNKKVNVDHCMGRYLSHNGSVSETWKQDDTVWHTISTSELIGARRFNRIAYRGVKRIAADVPILILAGADDQVFSPRAIKKRVKKFGSRDVTVQVLPDKGHLLLEIQEVDAPTQQIVDAWLAKQVEKNQSRTTTSSAAAAASKDD